MLTIKMYRTSTEMVVCRECSSVFLNTGVSMFPVVSGTPCTCDLCGIKSRAV